MFFNSIKIVLFFLLLLFCLQSYAYNNICHSNTKILIVYESTKGHTEKMAIAVVQGAAMPQVDVVLRTVDQATVEDVISADAIIVGSPVYNANVSPKIQEFINHWPFNNKMRNKIGAAFVTASGISAGQESTQLSILRSMLVFGMIPVGGEDWFSSFGAAAITGEQPFNLTTDVASQFLEKARGLGKRVAIIASVLKCQSIE